MNTRIQKLLILIGEEAIDKETRDYKKLAEVIFPLLEDKANHEVFH